MPGPTIYYASFADPAKPKGKQWLGGAYVVANSHAAAHLATIIQRINPGGQVQIVDTTKPPDHLPEHKLNRLITNQKDL